MNQTGGSAPVTPNKDCVACAEIIMPNAKLCKHCGTLQDDPRFAGGRRVLPGAKGVTSSVSEVLDPEEREAIEWFSFYDFVRYVDAGSEDELENLDPKKIWTHYADGLNGEFVTNGFLPDYDFAHGYYVMNKSWDFEENSVFLRILAFTDDCKDCEDGYDEDGNFCETCHGGETSFLARFFD